MTIPTDKLLKITHRLKRRYGEDLAHDVVVALLKRRNPIENLDDWVNGYACLLWKRAVSNYRRPRVTTMCDMPVKFQQAYHDLIN